MVSLVLPVSVSRTGIGVLLYIINVDLQPSSLSLDLRVLSHTGITSL